MPKAKNIAMMMMMMKQNHLSITQPIAKGEEKNFQTLLHAAAVYLEKGNARRQRDMP